MFDAEKLISDDIFVNGLKFHYYRTGGDKPALVLLHGITDNGLCWLRLAQQLGNDFDLIMPDARGHGLSDAPDSGYSFQEQAADVVSMIETLELIQPVLLGHSMGAMTAIEVAVSRPKLVRALILEDPPLSARAQISIEESKSWKEEASKRIEQMQSQTLSEIISERQNQAPNWPENELSPWAEAKHQVNPRVVEIATSLQYPWRSAFGQIACPILLLTADHKAGGRVTPELADEAAALFSNGRVVNIHDAGHNIRRDQFKNYLTAVSNFLAEVHSME